jgi:ribosome maturation factor RimP
MVSPEFFPVLSAAREQAVRHGAEVIEVVIRGDRSRRVVELYVDTADGVSLDLCQEISKSLKQEIEEKPLIAGSYRLDVSSPGLDRPLKFPWQYRKHRGRTLQVTVETPEGRHSVEGTLVEADDEGIVLQIGKDSPPRRFTFSSLAETKVKSPW